MRANSILSCLALTALAAARPMPKGTKMLRREVPQEHSHEQFITTVRTSLRLNNPANIGDPVFGLLGNKAAAGGLGQLSDVECLQQATADQAFTNAKAANDIPGMTAALIYRALERNTIKVGEASNPCTSIKPVNPEIAAIKQHQDPAGQGAALGNKAVVLELAKQIAAVGGNPQDSLKSGTFTPGDLADTSGKGNTCDNQDDPIGCIFTQNRLIPDATADEITAAVGGAGGAGNAAPAAQQQAPQQVAPQQVAPQQAAPQQATPQQAAQQQAQQAPQQQAGASQQSGCNAAQSSTSSATAPVMNPPVMNPPVMSPPVMSPPVMSPPAINVSAMNPPAMNPPAMNPPAMTPPAMNPPAMNAPAMNVPVANVAVPASGAQNNTTGTAGAAAAAASAPASTGLNFGSCPNAGIIFGPGFDGRKENSFQPADTMQFTHGSAQSIDIITDFMCDRFGDRCGANDAVNTVCMAAIAATKGKTGQGAATAWNVAFGLTNVPNLTGT